MKSDPRVLRVLNKSNLEEIYMKKQYETTNNSLDRLNNRLHTAEERGPMN